MAASCSSNRSFRPDGSEVNVLKDESGEFDFDIHSYGYLLVDLSDFTILYSKNDAERIFPASLTKILTLDTVLHLCDDLSDRSYVTSQQVEDLIRQDASLAYIRRDYDYSIEDLLYAMMLPSGADACLALENYFSWKGIDLIEEMNSLAQEIGCSDSHFVNTTGLHDDDHYTSLDDLYKIVLDTLTFRTGRQVMESMYHVMEDRMIVATGIRALTFSKVKVLGGKTGFTDESGQSIIVLYRDRGRSYILLLCNAMGNYYEGDLWHFDDAFEVFDKLY